MISAEYIKVGEHSSDDYNYVDIEITSSTREAVAEIVELLCHLREVFYIAFGNEEAKQLMRCIMREYKKAWKARKKGKDYKLDVSSVVDPVLEEVRRNR